MAGVPDLKSSSSMRIYNLIPSHPISPGHQLRPLLGVVYAETMLQPIDERTEVALNVQEQHLGTLRFGVWVYVVGVGAHTVGRRRGTTG